jgi:hypothetical protein
VRLDDRNNLMRIRIALLLVSLLAGCTVIRPLPGSEQGLPTTGTFSHADFDRVLERFVDEQGRVDYAALKSDPSDLDRYFFLLSSRSPDSHPALFPGTHGKLAYWINAYNATAMRFALSYYPITSVMDVKPPFLFFFLPDASGFFAFQRAAFGGRTTSLYYLENRLIRKRFAEPRIHFALNCCARGCPRLPREAFSGERLDEQLDREARKFMAEARNFRIDDETQTIFLAEIFQWYKKDFLKWHEVRFPGQETSLLQYVALYLSPEKAAALKSRAASYQLRFIPFDWRLNDRSGPA